MSKTINICANEAEAIQELLPNECLISINNTTNPPWNLKVDGERVLRVFFDDVPFPIVHKGLQYAPMNVDQAHQIIDFIKKWEGNDFLINCHAGIARSSSAALFLHLHFGYDLKPNFYRTSDPNVLVLGLLVKEYMKLKNGVYGDNWTFTF